jgi:hypothetical protein
MYVDRMMCSRLEESILPPWHRGLPEVDEGSGLRNRGTTVPPAAA